VTSITSVQGGDYRDCSPEYFFRIWSKKEWILFRNFEVQRTVLFLDSEFVRNKTFKDSTFPLELPSLQIELLLSVHNRDRCHCRIDLQSITPVLDSGISSFSSFLYTLTRRTTLIFSSNPLQPLEKERNSLLQVGVRSCPRDSDRDRG
jgi:hypothetical protein